MNILVICKLGFQSKESFGFSHDPKAVLHLSPIALSRYVDRLHILRFRRLTETMPCMVEHIHMNWRGNYLLLPLAMLHLFVKALWICWRHQIDYIAGFTIPYGVLAWLTAKITRRNVGMSFIGGDLYTGILKRWYRRIVVFMLRHCDYVTVTGTEMKDILIAHGVPTERLYVLPHGVDMSPSPLNVQEKRYDMIFIGELIYRKRVDTLLEAFQLVKQTREQARFCIVGDGPLRTELENQARQSGVADVIDFVGFQEDVQPYLEQSKVFVMASNREGLPFAMIEAMVCGLVPVVTDVGTIRDVVRDSENGFLVGVGESQVIAKRVLTLLADENLYKKMSCEATAVREKFSYQRVIEVWDTIFSQTQSGESTARTWRHREPEHFGEETR